jgi:hypothetical protein
VIPWWCSSRIALSVWRSELLATGVVRNSLRRSLVRKCRVPSTPQTIRFVNGLAALRMTRVTVL